MRVALVSAGAMGSAIGARLVGSGTEVATTLHGRSAETARRAREAGIECVADLDALVACAEIVLSVAPPDQAEVIASDVSAAAARTASAPLVCDLNAISPDSARRIERVLADGGLDLVDGSISGPPPRRQVATRIYLSGARAGEVALLPLPGIEVISVGDRVGSASAVKMCTASVYKGRVGLLAHALLTAQANGVLGHVLDDLGQPAEEAAETLRRAAPKSWRYVGEMHEIAATQAAAGLTPELFEAMATVYAGLATSPVAQEPAEAHAALEEVLEALRPTSRGDPRAPGRA